MDEKHASAPDDETPAPLLCICAVCIAGLAYANLEQGYLLSTTLLACIALAWLGRFHYFSQVQPTITRRLVVDGLVIVMTLAYVPLVLSYLL